MVIYGLDKDVKILVETLTEEQISSKWTIISKESFNDQDKQFIKKYDLRVSTNVHALKDVDVVFINNDNESALHKRGVVSCKHATTIPNKIYTVIIQQIKQANVNKNIPLEMNTLILETIHDGMIIVDEKAHIQFVNQRAKEIVDVHRSDVVGKHIRTIIPKSRLPLVMEVGLKEVNMQLELENGKKIITTRIPMHNEKKEVIGAFAVFKDITEVVHLAEENTDLKQVKMMLEAIIFSSLDAISVVDVYGKGLMINPAYTKITGLTEEEVIGKPAATDIYEGASVHDHVLSTGKNVQNATMKVGVTKKDVIVNAAPIVVDGKIVGSIAVIHDLSELHMLTNKLKKAQKEIRALEAKHTFNDIIGNSTVMTIAREQAHIGARTPAAVLLRGESGAGKELFAHAIHNESERSIGPFIRVNCTAISSDNIEGELFGYEHQSFSNGKPGLMEQAHNGSIFLDEIAELPQNVQVKLLRVLQENEMLRVGGIKPIPVDVRLIAASNKHLEREIANGTFREDLYYHLNRLPIFIPSLRERINDIHDISAHLIDKLNLEYSRDVEGFTNAAMLYLKQLPWNGNVRELENRIGRAMINMKNNDRMIDEHHLKEGWLPSIDLMGSSNLEHSKDLLKDAVDDFEKEFIMRIYRNNKFVKTKTAQALGISLRSLYNKLERFGIT